MATSDRSTAAPRRDAPPEHLRGPFDAYEPEVLRRIWDRLHARNEHFMGAIVGEEGSGKSYTAIGLANAVDPTFTPDRVLFEISDLLKILRDGEHEPGHAYVLDEAGVSMGKRTWQERGQVLANQALQLIRSHNLALFFTLPRLGELDSQAQGRLQAFFEIVEKEPDEQVVGKWKYMDPDRTDETGQIYKKFPRVYRNGQRIRVTRLKFAPPPAELTDPYEERKADYQEQVYAETLAELEGVDDEPEEEEDDDSTSLRELAAQLAAGGVDDLVSYHGQTKEPYINADLIRINHDLSHGDARAVKSLLEKQIDVAEEASEPA